MNFFIQFLTYFRILAAPIIFLLVTLSSNYGWALILFLFASASDYWDGYLARKYKLESIFGAAVGGQEEGRLRAQRRGGAGEEERRRELGRERKGRGAEEEGLFRRAGAGLGPGLKLILASDTRTTTRQRTDEESLARPMLPV